MINIERFLKIKKEYDKKNGITMDVLARKYSVSRQRIQQIISFDLKKYLKKRALKLIRKYIKSQKYFFSRDEELKDFLIELKEIIDLVKIWNELEKYESDTVDEIKGKLIKEMISLKIDEKIILKYFIKK